MAYSEPAAHPQTCWNYVRGNCSRRACKFHHPPGVSFPPYHRNSPFAASKPLPLSPLLTAFGENDATKSSSRNNGSHTTVYTPIAWKTAPCKHFSETGSCPLGNKCKFIHDVDLTRSSADVRSLSTVKLPTTKARAHCWSFVQGECKNASGCSYLHPSNKAAYKKYTPCLDWPNCNNLCEYKHPEPLQNEGNVASPAAAPAFVPHRNPSYVQPDHDRPHLPMAYSSSSGYVQPDPSQPISPLSPVSPVSPVYYSLHSPSAPFFHDTSIVNANYYNNLPYQTQAFPLTPFYIGSGPSEGYYFHQPPHHNAGHIRDTIRVESTLPNPAGSFGTDMRLLKASTNSDMHSRKIGQPLQSRPAHTRRISVSTGHRASTTSTPL